MPVGDGMVLVVGGVVLESNEGPATIVVALSRLARTLHVALVLA